MADFLCRFKMFLKRLEDEKCAKMRVFVAGNAPKKAVSRDFGCKKGWKRDVSDL
jgi:hypothetical protein